MNPDWNYTTELRGEASRLVKGHTEIAKILRQQFDYPNAMKALEAALTLQPSNSHLWAELAECWMNLNQFQKANACYREAISHDPLYFAALLGLSDTYTLSDEPETALEVLTRAETQIHHDKDREAMFNVAKGNASFYADRFEDAVKCYQACLAVKADFAPTWGSLGGVYTEMGKHEDARKMFLKSFELAQEPRTEMNLALNALLLGRYEEGWKHYDRRLTDPVKYEFKRFRDKPRWDGKACDTVYIHSEQGIGDVVQFMRFLPEVRKRGVRKIILEVTDGWVNLAQAFEFADKIVPRDPAFIVKDDYNAQIPLMSLPLVLGMTHPNSMPKPPYTNWRKPQHRDKPLIAVTWYGNPLHVNDKRRSMPLEALAPLFELDAEFVTFSPEEKATADIERTGFPLTQIKTDLVSAAKQLANVDWLVSVDTSHIHLAGASGTPAHLLIPFASEWRWGLNQKTSLWYPSVQIHRQHKPGDWESAVCSMKSELTSAML